MPYRNQLRETFAATDVKRVAIVDDAFDEPDFDRLEQTGFAAIRTAIDDLLDRAANEAGVLSTLQQATSLPPEVMKDRLQEPATFKPLWELFALADPAGELYGFLAPLFGVLGAERRDKLHPLLLLRELVRESTGAAVTTFDSSTTAADVSEFDLILLDFYLAPPNASGRMTAAGKREARGKSIEFLARLVEATPIRTPLVLLISSLASVDDLPDFRREAKMLMSKLAFLPKDFVASDPPRAQHAILSLVKNRPKADALVGLLQTWRETVNEAAEELMVRVRELDLTDYSYLQAYRLAAEKTPLAQYLTWLFSGQLTDLVELGLQKKKAERLVKNIDLPEPVPGLVAPTPGIARVYSALTTSRVPVASGSFKPRAWSGDIYLATARYNDIYGKKLATPRRHKALPEILAVITPACDLVPGRGAGPKLKTVTMIGGTLAPLKDSVHPDFSLIMLNEKPFVVTWDPKWPVTMALDAMGPGPGSSMSNRYQWVGRLRDLYHAELQHKLMSDVSRVGLPVAPTMPENVPLRILALTRVQSASPYEIVVEHEIEAGAAWTFAGERGKRSFCLRADLAWTVRDWVRKASGTTKALTSLRGLVDNPAYIGAMQSPVHFSGEKNAVAGTGAGMQAISFKRVSQPMAETAASDTVALVIALGIG